MLTLPIYLVDAFTDKPLKGNPAAVCPLQAWLPDELLQAITVEHNQSETAFFVPQGNDFELRWFTVSDGEIDLCGHATLAAAHVIFTHLGYVGESITFHSRFSGTLRVSRAADSWLTLDFPSWMPQRTELTDLMTASMGGAAPREVHVKRDYLLVYDTAAQVRAAQPDFGLMKQLARRVCITAPGDSGYDFVSRFFCPGDAQDEDAVTGSAHSMLIPFWAARLSKSYMLARQVSARGGDLRCGLRGERVLIGGQAVTYLEGTARLPD